MTFLKTFGKYMEINTLMSVKILLTGNLKSYVLVMYMENLLSLLRSYYQVKDVLNVK